MTGDMGQMQIRSGRSRFMLQALPESDFPDLAAGDLPHRFTLPAADLKRLIEKTQFAISTEETRYYLNGIYLHTIDAGGLHRAARGRHRRPPPRPGRDPGADRFGRHARRHRAAQGRGGDRQARGGRLRERHHRTVLRQGPPDLRRRRADLQAHRRHLPRLPARHPGRERQGSHGRARAISRRPSTASPPSRRNAAAR